MRPNPPEFNHSSRLPTILDWVWGRLRDRRTEDELAAAMVDDAHLRDDVEWARQLHRVANDLPLHDPPELLHQRLRQQFRRWSAGEITANNGVPVLRAVPVFDSSHDRLQLGVRRAARDEHVQHLVWRTEWVELILQVRTTGGGRVRLDGQILLADEGDCQGFEVTVQGPGFTVVTDSEDDFHRFGTEVPSTVNQLTVACADFTLVADVQLDP